MSDTRDEATDRGGRTILDALAEAGHTAAGRVILPDEPDEIRDVIQRFSDDPSVQAILVTGGTGVAARDHTIDIVESLLTKALPGFGELFRMLSFEEIGPAAMMSRATGGVVGQTVLLAMPGSPAAVRLAMKQLILPELPHLVREATRLS